MGNLITELQTNSCKSIPQNYKLYSILPIDSSIQQLHMKQILIKRSKLAQCPFICTIKQYQFVNEQSSKFICNIQKKLIVYYDNFDYRLMDIPLLHYPSLFNQSQICNLIHCITQAMYYLKTHKIHHGDISLQNICKNGQKWTLLDKVFIRNGINAYEKVLQGESGFISPKQMIKIRYGHIKQSPDLSQTDDIFSLGMLVLQLASRIPSKNCYRQMNIRFNQNTLNHNLDIVSKLYSKQFYILLLRMITPVEQQRIKLNSLRSHPIIKSFQINVSNCRSNGSINTNDNAKDSYLYQTASHSNMRMSKSLNKNPFSDQNKPQKSTRTTCMTRQTTQNSNQSILFIPQSHITKLTTIINQPNQVSNNNYLSPSSNIIYLNPSNNNYINNFHHNKQSFLYLNNNNIVYFNNNQRLKTAI